MLYAYRTYCKGTDIAQYKIHIIHQHVRTRGTLETPLNVKRQLLQTVLNPFVEKQALILRLILRRTLYWFELALQSTR